MFQIIDVRTSELALSQVVLVDPEGKCFFENGIVRKALSEKGDTIRPVSLAEDINDNDVVNVQDLVFLSSNLDKRDKNETDVNGDGVVDIVDLVKVAGAIGKTTGSPLVSGYDISVTPTLLTNYLNPFNPETWIPYQLAASTDVTLTIYMMDGRVVCTLALGHQRIGTYQDRSRAGYWDGKNSIGEPVASGVFLYADCGRLYRKVEAVNSQVNNQGVSLSDEYTDLPK